MHVKSRIVLVVSMLVACCSSSVGEELIIDLGDLSDPFNPTELLSQPKLLLPIHSESSEEAENPPIAPHKRPELSDDLLTAVAGGNRFAFELFAELRGDRQTGNLMISPASISTALAMTYAGARGRTAEQMADVLHFDLPHDRLHPALGSLIQDLNTEREGYELSINNRLFGQEGFEFKREFLETTANDYGAPLESLNFQGAPEPSRIHINDWVAEKTKDRIKDLLPSGAITPDTRLVLTNTIYFNGQWKNQFLEESTRDAPFYLSAGEATTGPLMFQREDLRFGQFDGYKMLELPYAGDDLSMVVVLPDTIDGLVELESEFTAEQFTENVAALRERETLVYLPKFTFEDSFSLADPLIEMGMSDAFDMGADFSGIADAGLAIDGVVHKTFIDVNEEGTEAAAATAVVIGTTCMCGNYNPPVEFRADHPFLFALRDNHSGSILFLGRMSDPGVASGGALTEVPEPSAGVLMIMALCWGRGWRNKQQVPQTT